MAKKNNKNNKNKGSNQAKTSIDTSLVDLTGTTQSKKIDNNEGNTHENIESPEESVNQPMDQINRDVDNDVYVNQPTSVTTSSNETDTDMDAMSSNLNQNDLETNSDKSHFTVNINTIDNSSSKLTEESEDPTLITEDESNTHVDVVNSKDEPDKIDNETVRKETQGNILSSEALSSASASNSERESLVQSDTTSKADEPIPSPPKTKKRLTLQERLALAAKGKNKNINKTTSKVISPSPVSPERSITPESTLTPIITNTELPHPAPTETNENQVIDPYSSADQEILSLKAKVTELLEENKKLKSTPKSSISSSNLSFEKERKDLLAKISAKEDTINQLLKEGEALSMKELKLNSNIKSLKLSNLNLESVVKDYSDKNEEYALKLNELEDFLINHKFKSVQQLIEGYNDMAYKLADAENDLEKEKNYNWEGKYKEQQKLFDNESTEKKKYIKNLNECKIQLEMTKSQASLDIGSKDSMINELKKEVSDLKEEYTQEISRLESKLEFFRVESETFSNSGESRKPHESDSKFESKVIDYDEFAKLSETHHNLQQQYVSSQANWKLIESNLLNKVDTLTSTVDSLKKSKIKLTNDIKRFQNEISNNNNESEKIETDYEDLLKNFNNLKYQLKVQENDLLESQEKFDKLKQVFSTERQSLEAKIKSLTESYEKSKSDQFQTRSLSIDDNSQSFLPPMSTKKFQEGGLHINIEPPPTFQMRSSSSSIMDSPSNQFSNMNSWPEIKFGESSTTPAITKDFSGIFMNRSNNDSSASLNEDGDDNIMLNDDAFSFQSKSQNNVNHGGSISALMPVTGNNHIQLVSKMSSNIRRLEIEINTLREENSVLATEKEQAQKEILSKYKLNNESDTLKSQIQTLEEQIEEKSIKEQTMLELIGEKSEQVEELRADVADLKDLCRQQVQQMIELQESK